MDGRQDRLFSAITELLLKEIIMTQKTMLLSDILTDGQILIAMMLDDRKKILEQLILPNMDTINFALDQENDPVYLSYAVHYAVTRLKESVQ